MECAAIQDTLVICEVLDSLESENGKRSFVWIVSMLTKLGKREYSVREDMTMYGDSDSDHDNDNDIPCST